MTFSQLDKVNAFGAAITSENEFRAVRMRGEGRARRQRAQFS